MPIPMPTPNGLNMANVKKYNNISFKLVRLAMSSKPKQNAITNLCKATPGIIHKVVKWAPHLWCFFLPAKSFQTSPTSSSMPMAKPSKTACKVRASIVMKSLNAWNLAPVNTFSSSQCPLGNVSLLFTLEIDPGTKKGSCRWIQPWKLVPPN